MKTIINNPHRLFFCNKCLKHFTSDEYTTNDWLNFDDSCPICSKEIHISSHENNLL